MNETVKQILENHLSQVKGEIEWETESITALQGEVVRLEKKLERLQGQKTDLLMALGEL